MDTYKSREWKSTSRSVRSWKTRLNGLIVLQRPKKLFPGTSVNYYDKNGSSLCYLYQFIKNSVTVNGTHFHDEWKDAKHWVGQNVVRSEGRGKLR